MNILKVIVALILLNFAYVAQAEEKVYTREQLFAPITRPDVNPERRYAELDLNGDGNKELLLSTSISLGGTGGLTYNLYLGLGDERYRKVDQRLANLFALEVHGNTRRLWSYSHCSSQSGTILYSYFEPNGKLKKTQPLFIYPGDGGSEMGNAIYKSIFSEGTILNMKTTDEPQE